MHTPIAAGHLLDRLLVVHGALAYLIGGALAFGEAALFFGFVLPGETAVLLGGVLAYERAVSLPGMIALVVAGAIIGDSVGYEVGRHFGTRLLNLRLLRSRRHSIDKAHQYLRDKGGRAVFLGRFTAFFCAVMPALAGVAGMHYRRFLAFNAAGGLLWGTGVRPARLPGRSLLPEGGRRCRPCLNRGARGGRRRRHRRPSVPAPRQ